MGRFFVSIYELSLDEKDKRTRRRPTDLFWYLTDRRAQQKNAEFAALISTSIFRSSAGFLFGNLVGKGGVGSIANNTPFKCRIPYHRVGPGRWITVLWLLVEYLHCRSRRDVCEGVCLKRNETKWPTTNERNETKRNSHKRIGAYRRHTHDNETTHTGLVQTFVGN